MSVLARFTPNSLRLLTRALKDRLYLRRIHRATPVLVYQMGKVGSSSIYRSLQRQYPGVVAHSHGLKRAYTRPLERTLFDWGVDNKRPLKVISLTREPVGRNVSSFFQNFERFTGVPYVNSTYAIEELGDIFLERFTHDAPLTWFDRHIRRLFDIDVYSQPFPESGVCTYQKGNIELLLMRVEISNDAKTTALKRFLKLEHLEFLNVNRSVEKAYSQTYREFLSSVKLPLDYLERMCDSKYFRHFYDDATRDAINAKWAEPVSKAA